MTVMGRYGSDENVESNALECSVAVSALSASVFTCDSMIETRSSISAVTVMLQPKG